MDITAEFLPVAVELIQQVFPTDIVYIRSLGGGYDPSTGDVTQRTEEYAIKAGILSRGRTEERHGWLRASPLDRSQLRRDAASAQDR